MSVVPGDEERDFLGEIETQPLADRLEVLASKMSAVLEHAKLSDHDRKVIDLARRELQLDAYALRKAADLGHRAFLADVRRQIAAGRPDDPGLTAEDLEALARGA